MPLESSRAQLYRERAREVRAIAESCHDTVIKEQLMAVADEYETLARQVEIGVLRN
ncbi:MAG TPA: hypothetical protein VGP48_12025 [Stellaceae bacterium]|jgi:hypothetical protein|nr:hypothetical protein [Stellaceae bacterium]